MSCVRNLLFFLTLWPISLLGQEEAPYWRNKPQLMKDLEHGRRVLVSVKKQQSDQVLFYRMEGVGVVNVPLTRVKNEMAQFEKLPQVSSVFKKVEHDPKLMTLLVHIEAAGFQTKLNLKYEWARTDQESWRLNWSVQDGVFKGMYGHFALRSLNHRKTEVSLWAHILEPKIPVPQFLLTFTLEVIAEKVAQKMRSFIETEYSN